MSDCNERETTRGDGTATVRTEWSPLSEHLVSKWTWIEGGTPKTWFFLSVSMLDLVESAQDIADYHQRSVDAFDRFMMDGGAFNDYWRPSSAFSEHLSSLIEMMVP